MEDQKAQTRLHIAQRYIAINPLINQSLFVLTV